jgi:hypothetical protein
MGETRIPQTIPEFNDYINNTDDYLLAGTPTNRERLGLSISNGTDWHDKRVFWRDTLYPKYIDPLQSTSAVKTQVRDFMADFRTFGNPLLNIMVADPDANSNDEAVFKFVITPAAPSTPTTPITDPVAYETMSLNGGLVEFVCRPAHDSKHPSKHPESDSIQLAYLLQENDGPASPNPNPDPGGEIPDPDTAAMQKELFTKAVFIKSFGVLSKGKLLICYLRWYNTKHPNLAGPWTGPFVVGIA